MIELTWKRRLFIILIVALAFAGGVSLGWIGRGRYEQPVGGIPTTAAMQMAVTDEIEAEPSATIAPTEGAPTSTAAPTKAQSTIPTSTPTATPTPMPTETATPSGAAAEWATPEATLSPYHYGDKCSYSSQLGLFLWGDSEGNRWSLWDTRPIGDGGYLVLGLSETAGELRWLVGDGEDPCINTGQLAGVDGLQTYLRAVGQEELEIPALPEGWVN